MSNPYNNVNMAGWDLSDREDMDGLFIEGLCLSQEHLDAPVLPPNLTGVTFSYCNLDNVLVPAGNVLIECSHRRFKAMEDGYDWELDENDVPIKHLGD